MPQRLAYAVVTSAQRYGILRVRRCHRSDLLSAAIGSGIHGDPQGVFQRSPRAKQPAGPGVGSLRSGDIRSDFLALGGQQACCGESR